MNVKTAAGRFRVHDSEPVERLGRADAGKGLLEMIRRRCQTVTPETGMQALSVIVVCLTCSVLHPTEGISHRRLVIASPGIGMGQAYERALSPAGPGQCSAVLTPWPWPASVQPGWRKEAAEVAFDILRQLGHPARFTRR